MAFAPTGLILPVKAYTTAGLHAIGADEYNLLHTARAALDFTFMVPGIELGTVLFIAADYNAGKVLIDATPGYYWRNLGRRDGTVDNTTHVVRLRPGCVAQVWRLTTNEFWVIGGFARPSIVVLGTNGASGFIVRGLDGRYLGSWRVTLAAKTTTVLDFKTIYSGCPQFQGTKTNFYGFGLDQTPALTLDSDTIYRDFETGSSGARHKPIKQDIRTHLLEMKSAMIGLTARGAGTITLTNRGPAVTGFVHFGNLVE